MGLILALLDRWTPDFVIHRELDRVSDLTITALIQLINTQAPSYSTKFLQPRPDSLNTKEKRLAMAKEHVALTEALTKALGKDQAIKLGRAALFEAGKKLGQEARRRFGIHRRKDLALAAEVLYRVFDIEVEVEGIEGESAVLIVNRCMLSKVYSELTCQILSATDEGIVRGLAPNAHMKFKQHMTGGCSKCRADIKFDKETA